MDFLGLPDGLQDRPNVLRPSFTTLAEGTQPHGLIRYDRQSRSSGTAVEHSDGSRVPHLKPARSGLPPGRDHQRCPDGSVGSPSLRTRSGSWIGARLRSAA